MGCTLSGILNLHPATQFCVGAPHHGKLITARKWRIVLMTDKDGCENYIPEFSNGQGYQRIVHKSRESYDGMSGPTVYKCLVHRSLEDCEEYIRWQKEMTGRGGTEQVIKEFA
jgi:hypothetical protein